MHETNTPNLVVIGGGTGSSTLLSELKHHTPNISAIVNMSDDGGSSGRLREQFGVMPPGDVRQCLTALSNNPETAERFRHRYSSGLGAGHAHGNLVLAAMELESDFASAVKAASKLLEITGEVLPVTLDNHQLVMEDGDQVVYGEYKIGHRKISRPRPKLWLEPPAKMTEQVEAAIQTADQIVIAPGNFYGSVLPALIVDGIGQAVKEANGQKIMIANLVNKPGQTDGWHVLDYAEAYESLIGSIDAVLYNKHPINDSLLGAEAGGAQQVDYASERFGKRADIEAIGDNFVSESIYAQDPSDHSVQRTALRHNAVKISQHLIQLTREEKR